MTTETLEYPQIEEAAQPVAVVAPPAAPDLAKVDLTEVALAQFGDWSADVRKVRENLSTLVLDLSTQAKVDDAKSLRHRLIGQPRADVRKVSKALKSKLTAVSKAVGALEDAAVAAYDKAEELITPQIDKRQAELDAEREEKARVERERVAGLEANLLAMQVWIDRCNEPGVTAERVKNGMLALSQIELKREAWAEFYDRAINRRSEVLAAMQATFERKLIAEAEAQRLEEQRAEAARIQALLDERQRALDAQAAELKRQADELAAARAESERLDRLAAENRARLELQQAEDARVAALAEKRRQDAAAESVRIAATAPVLSDKPVADAKAVTWIDAIDAGDTPEALTTGEPRDQTPAEIEAANGPEVDLPEAPASLTLSDGSTLSPDDLRLVEAGPIEDDEDEGGIDLLLRDCMALMDVLRTPYAGRFPSHPKPGPEFWSDVRWRIENLQPRLLMAAAAKKAGM